MFLFGIQSSTNLNHSKPLIDTSSCMIPLCYSSILGLIQWLPIAFRIKIIQAHVQFDLNKSFLLSSH